MSSKWHNFAQYAHSKTRRWRLVDGAELSHEKCSCLWKDRLRTKREAASAPVKLFRADSLSPYIRGISQESLPCPKATTCPRPRIPRKGGRQRGALLCHPPPPSIEGTELVWVLWPQIWSVRRQVLRMKDRCIFFGSAPRIPILAASK